VFCAMRLVEKTVATCSRDFLPPGAVKTSENSCGMRTCVSMTVYGAVCNAKQKKLLINYNSTERPYLEFQLKLGVLVLYCLDNNSLVVNYEMRREISLYGTVCCSR
jgi:RNA-binding protein YlmH